MASELVELRLPEFNLNVVAGAEIGVDPTAIASACDGLAQQVQNLRNFSLDLAEKQQSIVQGWEGDAAESLSTQFPKLIDAFDEIPVCINSIIEWATSYAEAMVQIDQNVSERINILGQ